MPTFLLCSALRLGLTTVRAVMGEPTRELIADVAKLPRALVPAPFVQKEAPAGYSYQQINCLDSIIRCVCYALLCKRLLLPFISLFMKIQPENTGNMDTEFEYKHLFQIKMASTGKTCQLLILFSIVFIAVFVNFSIL